ncbi:AsnC family transcriptional regulator [Pseudomonas putida]|nr:AsnC family transcriptional regulator [Pseudomonas putida]
MNQDRNLDKFDMALMAALQVDSSVPLRELANQVHLSTASVQRRIQRLQKCGVIKGNAAVIDPDKVGKVITLAVEVHAVRTQSIDFELMKKEFSGPEIQQCYYVTGDADFLLILTVSSMTEFRAIAKRLFYENPNVQWYRTIVVMDRVKATLQVPLSDSD